MYYKGADFTHRKTVNLLLKSGNSGYCAKMKNGFALHHILISMQLMMYIGNDLIEAIPLDLKDIPRPGYVGSVKRSLKMKYRELIQQFPEPPEFLVINPGQKTKQNSANKI